MPSTARHTTELVTPPQSAFERFAAACLRVLARTTFRAWVGPPLSAPAQRMVSHLLSPLMLGAKGTNCFTTVMRGVASSIVKPADGIRPGAILYLHGGGFCLGHAGTHRAITTRLSRRSQLPIWIPNYRLAPEHPYPAALVDALRCYAGLRDQGYRSQEIVVAGDSAGASLALALALRLREHGEPPCAGLMLISPLTDPTLSGESIQAKLHDDPMLRVDWLKQALRWYECPADAMEHQPLQADLTGLPPLLIQVGSDEVLLSDAVRLAQRAVAHGVSCQLEIHQARWHVYHLQAFYLRSARDALDRLAEFAMRRVAEATANQCVRRDGRLGTDDDVRS